MSGDYEFTKDWFSSLIPVWREILTKNLPQRILEVGSFEGRSTTFLIEHCSPRGPLELHCVDSWGGGVEHSRLQMSDVERRFDANIAKALAKASNAVEFVKHKSYSQIALAKLMNEGKLNHFDLIYVDGSHQAPDVLTDAVLSFQLLKVGGILAFDDYLWAMEQPGSEDSLNMPKPAIDAFVNIYQRKLTVLRAPLYQLYVRKTRE